MQDYYQRPECSNSDLTSIKQQIRPINLPDPYLAFLFGTLFDALLTENERVNYDKHTVDGERYSKPDFKKALKMKNSFLRDDFCREFIQLATFQDIIVDTLKMNFQGIDFELKCRCKWDILKRNYSLGGEIKSTLAKTQSEFESSVKFFDWDRQTAFYMDLTKTDVHVLIGISKVNFKVFKVFINRNSETYKTGLDKYTYLAYKYFLLFGDSFC